MQEFEDGVRDLHEKVGRLDELLHQRTVVADLSERRADAAHSVAEQTSVRVRKLVVAVGLAMFVWTPATAYGAVWVHEKVRNNCYPVVAFAVEVERTPGEESWYCGMFPGTDHPED